MHRRGHALRTIAAAGTLCGVLDGLSAIVLFRVLFGSTPAQVFRGIARGALGGAAATGTAPVVVGVVAHFTVALGAAAVYFAIARIRPAMNRHAILAGALYGACVHLFMNFVVIPLSAIGHRPIAWTSFLSVLVVHVLVVGPSISLTVKKMCYTR